MGIFTDEQAFPQDRTVCLGHILGCGTWLRPPPLDALGGRECCQIGRRRSLASGVVTRGQNHGGQQRGEQDQHCCQH
jgi:hypothetical protein